MSRIAVVGSLNMDLVVRTPHLPQPGETLIGNGFTTAPGGKGANQAVAAARLGAQVTLVGRVGADDMGRALREQLTADGVDTSCVTDDRAPTGVAVIQVDDRGQNTIVVASGANSHVSEADVESARRVIESAQALIVQLETPLSVVTHALQVAHDAGILTVLNPAPARPLPDELLSLCRVIAPNETEAALLTGVAVDDWQSAEEAARRLRQRGARLVVITLGARGALALNGGLVRRVLPFPVTAVDATAAGDAFVAALAVALSEDKPLDRALREASAAGALTATRMGAQPSLPTRDELQTFLESHAPDR